MIVVSLQSEETDELLRWEMQCQSFLTLFCSLESCSDCDGMGLSGASSMFFERVASTSLQLVDIRPYVKQTCKRSVQRCQTPHLHMRLHLLFPTVNSSTIN